MYKKKQLSFLNIAIPLVLALSTLLPQQPALALKSAPLLAQADPSSQCLESVFLLLQGRFTEAKPQQERALAALHQSSSANPGALGMCAIFLGIVHHSTRDWVEALEVYTVALEAFRADKDPQMEWAAQFAIGSVYLAQGRFPEAYTTLQESLPLTGSPANPDEEACADPMMDGAVGEGRWTTKSLKPLARAVNLNNIGLTIVVPFSQQLESISKTKTLEDAKSCMEATLQILQRLSKQVVSPETALLALLVQLLSDGGNTEEALSRLLTNLLVSPLIPELADAFAPIVLSNLGQIYAAEQQYDKALAHLEQALQQIKADQARNNPDDVQAIQPLLKTMFNLMGSDPELQTLIQLMPEWLNALSLVSKVVNLNGEAIVLNNLALVYHAQGQLTKAKAAFQDALVIYEEKLANYQDAVTTHVNLGWLAQQDGDDTAALAHYEQAIKLLASVRSVAEGDIARLGQGNLQTLNLVGNSGILAQQADVYALAASLYLQQDRPTKALQALEQGRARLFLDMMSAGNPRLPIADAQWLAAAREAFDLYIQAKMSLTQVRALAGTSQILLDQAQQQMARAEEEWAEFKTDDPKLLRLLPGTNTDIDLAALQSQVFSDTTMIVYYIAEGVLVTPTQQLAAAWVIDSDSITAVKLTINSEDIRARVNSMRASIDSRDFYFEAADWLYHDLFVPLKPYIQHENLIIVPYRSLYYLPFAALWDPETKRFLIEDYTITYAPSVSSLQLIQHNRNPFHARLLLLGNPDGSLPSAESEVTAIAQHYATEPITSTQAAVTPTVDLFTHAQATESLVYTFSGQVDIVHLAAHGFYSDTNPLATRIELAPDSDNDGTLEVHEVFGMRLLDANLVVLSACKTAMGPQSMGDEITGLTRAFLYAGTPSIVTTLWSVPDQASEALMISFYQHLRTEPSFAAALRAAQMEILSKDNWRDPFYWAAFTLHGDYLGVGE